MTVAQFTVVFQVVGELFRRRQIVVLILSGMWWSLSVEQQTSDDAAERALTTVKRHPRSAAAARRPAVLLVDLHVTVVRTQRPETLDRVLPSRNRKLVVERRQRRSLTVQHPDTINIIIVKLRDGD